MKRYTEQQMHEHALKLRDNIYHEFSVKFGIKEGMGKTIMNAPEPELPEGEDEWISVKDKLPSIRVLGISLMEKQRV